MTLAFYELTDRYRSLETLATTDDIPPEVIRDTLEALDGEWEQKAEAVAAYIRNLEESAAAKEAAAKAVKQRADQLQKRADSLRAYLLFQFQALGKTRLQTDLFTIRVQNNPPSVVVDDETQIPAEFKVQPPAPPPRVDRKLISLAFKAGVDVPGCHPESGQSLRIEV